MSKIFKFLVFILIVEILLGYAIYIRNSSLESGHYISSTINAWIKLKRKIKEIKKTNITKSKETVNIDCSNIFNQNITFNIAGFNSFRNKIPFQTNLQFLNSFDSNKDYLILILGNSETYGVYMDEQSRLHSVIQNKLRNKINLYIDDNKNDFREYISAKLEGESLCKSYNKKINGNFFCPRLPPLDTDQNLSILPSKNNKASEYAFHIISLMVES